MPFQRQFLPKRFAVVDLLRVQLKLHYKYERKSLWRKKTALCVTWFNVWLTIFQPPLLRSCRKGGLAQIRGKGMLFIEASAGNNAVGAQKASQRMQRAKFSNFSLSSLSRIIWVVCSLLLNINNGLCILHVLINWSGSLQRHRGEAFLELPWRRQTFENNLVYGKSTISPAS